MTHEKIVDKIKKLRALSEKAGTEHEAAAAAAMAARMMLQHRIEEVELTEDGEEDEPIEEVRLDERTCKSGEIDGGYSKKLPRWRVDLLHGLATAISCQTIYCGASMKVIGRRDDVQTAIYIYTYARKEIWRLCKEEMAARGRFPGKRAWSNAFRHGASNTVVRRVREARRDVISEAEAAARRTGGVCTALVLQNDAAMSKDWMNQKYPRLGKMRGASISNGGGYSAGRRAGEKISIGGGKGLRAPAPQIRNR